MSGRAMHRASWAMGWPRVRIALAGIVAVLALSGPASASASTLSWSAPIPVEGSQQTMSAVSCPSSSLCVVPAFNGGDIAWSSDPTGGASAWNVAHVSGIDYLSGISCPSSSLCVAVGTDTNGDGIVLSSSDPTGDGTAWSVAQVDGTNFLESVSCPSTSLCVAADGSGNVITSTNPTGGASAWSGPVNVDGSNAISSISCPATSMCAAVDGVGNAITSTDPTGGASAWTVADIDGSNVLDGISCPSASRCVAGDESGNVVSSNDPTGGTLAWTPASVSSQGLGGISCPSVSFCVATVLETSKVVSSSDPTGGGAAWSTSDTGAADLVEVGCASAALCVADTGHGEVVTGTPPQNSGAPPSVETQPASDVTLDGATLHGVVDPSGEDTGWHFEYGTTTAFGQVAPSPDGEVSGSAGSTGVSVSLTGLSPATTYYYRLLADNGSGTATGETLSFTTPPAPGPVVSGVSPASGLARGGTSVTITGHNFTGATAVGFGGTPASTFRVDSDTQITAVSPPHSAGAVDVTVSTRWGASASTAADRFTYNGPQILSASPDPGPSAGGGAVLSGRDLGSATVTVGGKTVPLALDIPAEIVLVLPPGSGSTPMVVRNADGSARFAYSRYTYPTLTAITPDHGRTTGGYRASVTGTNLRSGDPVYFGKTVANLRATSSTRGTLTVPAGTGTVRVKAVNPGQRPNGSTPGAWFQYIASPCKTGSGRTCAFYSLSQVQLTEGSLPISDYQAEYPGLGFDQTQADPASTHGVWWCVDPNNSNCHVFARRPVRSHLTHSTIGANGGATAQANPFGSEVDLSAEAQGPVPINPDKPGYEEANGYTSNNSSSSGHTMSEDTWALDPQPTAPVPVYVSISASARAIISSSDLLPSNSDAQAGWQLRVGGVSAAGTDHYYVQQVPTPDGYSSITRFIDADTLTVNGRTAPGGASTALTVGPIEVSPSDWNSIQVFTEIDAALKVVCGTGDSATLCTGSAQASVDPVVISADPRYRAVSKAPARAAGYPLVMSSSAMTVRRGQRLSLSGAGFGSRPGAVIFTQGSRTISAQSAAWRPGAVRVRIPARLALGGGYYRVRTAGGRLSNPVPFTLRGRRPPPVIARIRPGRARAGERITITGQRFSGLYGVKFGTARARIVSHSSRRVQVVVPPGAGSVYVTVVTSGGPSAATTASMFRYPP